MKAIQIIAPLCLLLGCAINLINKFTDLPPWLTICSAPLLIISIILNLIILKKLKENKRRTNNYQDQDNDN